MHDDEELTPEERESLEALAREHPPADALEERIVRALRAEGLLRPPRILNLPPAPAWLGAAAAAAVALFVAGFALGQWIESRHTTEVLLAMREHDTAQAAALVQRTGSAYVSALGALATIAGSARPGEVAEGREVALNALRAAADQVVRLAPEDPVAVRLLQAVQGGAARDTLAQAGDGPTRLVWF